MPPGTPGSSGYRDPGGEPRLIPVPPDLTAVQAIRCLLTDAVTATGGRRITEDTTSAGEAAVQALASRARSVVEAVQGALAGMSWLLPVGLAALWFLGRGGRSTIVVRRNPARSARQRRFLGAELGRLRRGQATVTGMTEAQLRRWARR